MIISLLSLGATAQTTAPTWSSDVACIIYSHCSSCHNPNSIAPFSLLTYRDAQSEMVNIRQYVSTRQMPPYLPNTNYQHYTDMRTLTDQEINTIVAWVDSGAPMGTTATPYPQPTFTSGPVLTNPDVSGKIPTFTVPNTGTDLYQCFVITAPQDSDRYIKTIEVIPGNPNAVHHVLVFEDTSYSVVSADSAFAGPGYPDFGGTGSSTSQLIGAWVPGAGVDSLPSGMGIKLQKGARVIIQIHYPVTSIGLTDSTKVHMQFTPDNNVRNVSVNSILNYNRNMTDGPLRIPADSIKTFHEKFTVPVDVTILSVAPHGHLVCTGLKSFAVAPTGDTIPMIDIPRWDFHWQGEHSFQRPIKLSAGSKLWGIGTYNNSYTNPEAPQPLRLVTAGEATADEMMLFFFWYLPYQAGDENIIIDTTNHDAHYLNCVTTWTDTATSTGIRQVAADNTISIYPNPAQSVLNYQSEAEISQISITDIAGKLIKQLSASGRQGQIPVTDMNSGLYFIKLTSANGSEQTFRFAKD